MRACVVSLALLLASVGVAQSQPRVLDLDGRGVDVFQPGPGVRAQAFIFTTTDCPIANRYAPEISRLYETYRQQGVRFWLVYANPRETTAAIRDHAARFGYAMTIVRDPSHDLVRHLGVTVTPEAAVVSADGATMYRGRIDDRYTELGVDRPAATRRDLDEALRAIVAGRAVSTPWTKAVGCVLADFQPATFARDVAPIVFAKCASCHRPTGPAPFSLLTYADVRQRASQIAAVTERRYMPPWKAESEAGSFVGQARLTEGEIALFRQWADEGAVEGDRRDLPQVPTFADGWHLGTPDLIVTPPETFVLSAEPTDVFRIFVIRLPIEVTRYVTGLEFHPGNPRVVHHANIRLDPTPASRLLDARDPLPGYDGLMARSAVYPEGHFLGWTPGQVAPLVPDDMAWRLDPGTDLVVQLHMQPSGTPESVKPAIGLFFGRRIPSRTPTILRLGSQGIDIAPDDPGYIVRDSYVLPCDVELQAVQPHAHYRLRHVKGRATLPDGSEKSLVEIGEWDFRWQHVYRYTMPMVLPKGTRLSMEYTYDNSAGNPRNPQLPPRRVLWGQRSFDEMGDLWFQLLASERDRPALAGEIQRKMTAEDVIGYETMLRANPADTELHDDVALLYLSLGRAADAVRHFRASMERKPTEAATHFNLATALTVAGRLDEAIDEYRAALARRPDYGSAHNNLGSVLAAQGRPQDAVPHFREAVRLDQSNVQALRNLAWYGATVEGSDRDTVGEAVRAGETAARLTARSDAQVLDALAAAYAAAGEFRRAREAAEQAVAVARDDHLRQAIRERLAFYRQGRAFRLP